MTIKDIAKMAGVSYATVSRSLNDSPLVADETKKKIKEIARAVGFEFNAGARSLSTRRCGTMGVIYPDEKTDFSSALYYHRLVSEIRANFERDSIDIITSFPTNTITGESSVKHLVKAKKIDGIILIHPDIFSADPEAADFLKDCGVPYVFLHHDPGQSLCRGGCAIFTDHFSGGRMATRYLLSLGHRCVATITDDTAGEEYVLRTRGYAAALGECRLPADPQLILHGRRDIRSCYRLIREKAAFLKQQGVTAIFAQTDAMAIGTMEAFKELGYGIPEDFSIIGYDDIDLITSFTPALTTIRQPMREMATLASKTILHALDGQGINLPEKTMLNTTLVVRGSCRANA